MIHLQCHLVSCPHCPSWQPHQSSVSVALAKGPSIDHVTRPLVVNVRLHTYTQPTWRVKEPAGALVFPVALVTLVPADS